MGAGDRQLGLADAVLQDFALVPADLARLLCLLVADCKGGEADGWEGELSAPCRHVRAGLDHRQHSRQLFLNVILAESLADVDEVRPDVLCADRSVVGLAESALLIWDQAWVALLQLLQHRFGEVGVLPAALSQARAASLELNVGRLSVAGEVSRLRTDCVSLRKPTESIRAFLFYLKRRECARKSSEASQVDLRHVSSEETYVNVKNVYLQNL